MFAEYFIFRFLSEIDVISCQSFPTVRESRCCSHENITGGRRRPSSDLITYMLVLALHLYFSSFFLGEEMSAFYCMQEGIAVATLTSEEPPPPVCFCCGYSRVCCSSLPIPWLKTRISENSCWVIQRPCSPTLTVPHSPPRCQCFTLVTFQTASCGY